MATIVLGAVGTAIGGGFGGAILGLSGAAIGGMIGAGIGSMVDSWIVSSLMPGQRIEGQRMDSLRMTSATEGVVIPRLHGRMRITFYPFVMMDVPAGNTLPDPYSDNAATIGQPVLPWRGRITCSPAAGFAGTVDKTATAAAQVNAFFGNAQPSDFSVSDGVVTWTGPAGDWGLRRMILHYAHLCTAAGGVDAFLIGSEMRGLTQIRSGASTYPAVQAFRDLAAAVRSILGAGTRISYAADWSEYHSHRPTDGSGDVFFHLDPLWADSNIDFIGIDNYLPLSDWRDGWDHADAQDWPSIYDRAYLQSNIAGGEYFDWYYADEAARIAQDRTPIEDTIAPGPGGDMIVAMPTGSPAATVAPNSTFGLAAGVRADSITLSCAARIPPTLSEGLLVEISNNNNGLWFGLAGGEIRLIVVRPSGGGAQIVGVDASPWAGQDVDLVAAFDTATGDLFIAINSVVVAQGGWGAPAPGSWGNNNACGYGIANGPVPGGANTTNAPWAGTLNSDLQIWSGEAPTIAFVPGETPEPWVWRQKDIRGWWSSEHRNRPAGAPASTATAWVPESKPIWLTELGCPAVDRGTNQPNVFFDPKSSESFVPYFSRGWRDDAIQRAYLEATWLFWGEAANNPVSSVYGQRMVNVAEAAAWTWDARPYPFFPELSDLWADGENWRLGHWLTGRLGAVSLAALVRYLCRRAGLQDAWIDVSGLTGAVDGYVISALESPRTSITMLARHFGFDAVESEGRIRFVMRGSAPVAVIAPDAMVSAGSGDVMDLTRGQETELPQALKWQVARADEDYDGITVESRRITVDASRVSSDSFPMAVPPEEADRRCRRALMEAWVGRETGSFRLPPSMLALDPADVILLDHDGRLVEMRILTASDAEARAIETIRQDRAAYDLPPGSPRAAHLARPVVFGAPLALIMDLPQLREDHVPHHPLIAAYARPWPGEMAAYRSPEDSGFELLTTFSSRARIGALVADLYAGPTSRFDHGNSVYVDLLTGTLKSVTDLRLFGGENVLSIEQPGGAWEILQFGAAELLAPGRYRLSRLLRGQRGTEADMAPMVPTGARVVVLDAALAPLPVNEADLGLPWNWRIGPSAKPVSDDSYTALPFTPRGVGLRPFSAVHVEQPWRRSRVPGDLTIRWVRRDRSLAADNWGLIKRCSPAPIAG